ncbi:MAG: SPOR domain-containing protein [Spirochaetia bacterium]
MEHQRVYTVIIAVTVFLAAVLGVGLWWFYPRTDQDIRDEEPGLAETFDPFQYVRDAGTDKNDVIGLTEETEDPEAEEDRENGDDDVYIVYGESKESDEPARETAGSEKPSVIPEPAARTVPVVKHTEQKPDHAKADTRQKKETTPVSADTPKKVPEVSRQPEYRTVSEYWIQTGSFKTMDRAEYANTLLSEHGISGVITTKSVNNVTYYRLRVGPFGDKKEAEKFLGWIKSDTDFQGSYISLVSSKKLVN